ncbi:hypothetical protein MGA5115_03318 [Marinomonas gallaica]|uniref:Uncharacterized protein n=1 Tax=Marinomonas gallaica TaxID=1806667 RepID=A0A1C3JVI5_9GAMM|nr:hypothetical protein MGA5115_03318 [Marinomonas gallaica]SBT22682.1 hypothetical protein MGA5116_03306 [Marinomonas gallaica]
MLVGGQGQDTMTGGEGNDLFVLSDYSQGKDTIEDFHVNDDALDVSDLLGDLDGGDDLQALLNDKLDLQVNDDGSGMLSIKDGNNALHQAVEFGSDSDLTVGNEITVIFQDQEFKINTDG